MLGNRTMRGMTLVGKWVGAGHDGPVSMSITMSMSMSIRCCTATVAVGELTGVWREPGRVC